MRLITVKINPTKEKTKHGSIMRLITVKINPIKERNA